ncbi:FERM/acyl-CoA-binding protein, 3-helical bundle [Artemisia annua]|uniref:FERM/acyl-CoA-binding protein, 3-helical bundle n=1 Tax=Artemisia annua TaxID=35608 RepID=A0A2U1PAZ5_ARTAN|nr:FERM/acyl-CoA-binding protein, 3-helical bundle [Artemisia annua]
MEMLVQFFVTMIASFIFCMLIMKITSFTNRKKIKVVRKSKSLKKVRFALKHEEFFINKIVDEPSETKTVVFNAEILDESMTLVDEKNLGKCVKLTCDDDDDIDEDVKKDTGLISDDDDDWEGVEKSDLQKRFGLAVDYYGKNGENLESDVEIELYGLHKVATEGPCHESQPMALKLSARAKWDAWQKLGNMDPDVAVEKYVAILSEKVPGWSQG